eukprot:2958-Heterococcus_DN1.PRE.1
MVATSVSTVTSGVVALKSSGWLCATDGIAVGTTWPTEVKLSRSRTVHTSTSLHNLYYSTQHTMHDSALDSSGDCIVCIESITTSAGGGCIASIPSHIKCTSVSASKYSRGDLVSAMVHNCTRDTYKSAFSATTESYNTTG